MDGRFLHLETGFLAKTLRTPARSVRRWKHQGRMPALAYAYLALITDGELGGFSREWAGWSLREGAIESPEGARFTPGEIRALPLRRQQIAALEIEARASATALKAAVLRARREPAATSTTTHSSPV